MVTLVSYELKMIMEHEVVVEDRVWDRKMGIITK